MLIKQSLHLIQEDVCQKLYTWLIKTLFIFLLYLIQEALHDGDSCYQYGVKCETDVVYLHRVHSVRVLMLVFFLCDVTINFS